MRKGLVPLKSDDDNCDKAEELARSILSTHDLTQHQKATVEEKEEQLFEEVAIDVKVKSYAPRVFRFMRAIDGIEEWEVMKSVSPDTNRAQLFKTRSGLSHASGGKSGSFFFFTEDRRFIIKTMSRVEKDAFLKILPRLTQHLAANGGKSLISRIYGIYRVWYNGIQPIYLML